MPSIEDLLHRRTDLSTFLVHFTRDSQDKSAMENLISILWDDRLRVGRPMGMASGIAIDRKESNPEFYESQRVVSFTETPLEHAWMMCEDIVGREMGFRPYGVAFTKTWGRAHGINPVWYVDISARGIDWLTKPINALIDAALSKSDLENEIFRITPFVEQMGPTKGSRKEFWWEREWRLAGRDLQFKPRELVVVLAPEEEHVSIMTSLEDLATQHDIASGYYEPLQYVDPRWGLERIVARLAGVPDQDAGPLPPH